MTLSRRIFWTGTLAILAAGFTGGRIVADHLLAQKAPRTAAAWKATYRSAQELVRGVDAIVLATAADVQPGRVATSEGGLGDAFGASGRARSPGVDEVDGRHG